MSNRYYFLYICDSIKQNESELGQIKHLVLHFITARLLQRYFAVAQIVTLLCKDKRCNTLILYASMKGFFHLDVWENTQRLLRLLLCLEHALISWSFSWWHNESIPKIDDKMLHLASWTHTGITVILHFLVLCLQDG